MGVFEAGAEMAARGAQKALRSVKQQEQMSEQEFLKKALQVDNRAAEVIAQERESAAAKSLLEAKGRKKMAEFIEEARQAQAAAQAAKKNEVEESQQAAACREQPSCTTKTLLRKN